MKRKLVIEMRDLNKLVPQLHPACSEPKRERAVCSPAYLCVECIGKLLEAMGSVPWDCDDKDVIDAAIGSSMDGCGKERR